MAGLPAFCTRQPVFRGAESCRTPAEQKALQPRCPPGACDRTGSWGVGGERETPPIFSIRPPVFLHGDTCSNFSTRRLCNFDQPPTRHRPRNPRLYPLPPLFPRERRGRSSPAISIVNNPPPLPPPSFPRAPPAPGTKVSMNRRRRAAWACAFPVSNERKGPRPSVRRRL